MKINLSKLSKKEREKFESYPEWPGKHFSRLEHIFLPGVKTTRRCSSPDPYTEHLFEGMVHNDDGPARVFDSGIRIWKMFGCTHREGGPAVYGGSHSEPLYYIEGIEYKKDEYKIVDERKEGWESLKENKEICWNFHRKNIDFEDYMKWVDINNYTFNEEEEEGWFCPNGDEISDNDLYDIYLKEKLDPLLLPMPEEHEKVFWKYCSPG